MSLHSVREIEEAIGSLSQRESEELYEWLYQRLDPFEEKVAADFQAGRLDKVIQQALDDEKNGLTRAL